MATIAQAAAHINVSQQWFMELVNRGTFKRKNRGEYNLDAIRIAYIKMLRADRKADEGGGKSSLSDARTRKETARATREEFDLEISQRKWVLVEHVGSVVEAGFSNVRERVLSMPGQFTGPPGLTAEQVILCRAEIDVVAREALEELADPNKLWPAKMG